jgi:hypothetical protein
MYFFCILWFYFLYIYFVFYSFISSIFPLCFTVLLKQLRRLYTSSFIFQVLPMSDYSTCYTNHVFTRFITDLEILVVLVTRLLRQDLNRLVNGMEPVKLWDEG